MLLTLMKNEFIKIFRRGKTWVVFALFIALISLIGYITWNSAEEAKKYNSPEYQIQMSEEYLSYLEDDLKVAKEANDEEWTIQIEESIQYNKENIKNNKAILENGIDEYAWIKILDQDIVYLKEMIEKYEKEGINENNEIDYENLKHQLENLTYLKENNLKPLEGWEFTSNNFIQNGSMLFGMAILVAGIAVFISDMVSGEATPPTLKFLLIQPVSRGKVLLSKYLVSLTTVLALIIIPQVIGIGVVNLTSEINDSNYPITIGQEYEKVLNIENNEMELKEIRNTSEMITIKEFNFKSLAFQSLFIAATTSVVFMFSTLFKSSMISMATSVILTVFMTIAGQAINPVKKIAHMLFTTYADSVTILNSTGALMTKNQHVTITNGIICLVITLIVSYLISHINFTRKDMLI